MSNAQHWIEALQLSRHPEGGRFRQVYIAQEMIPRHSLPSRFTADKPFCTAIYYLLNEKDFSAFHRIRQDELWHFYDGASLTIHMIDGGGNYSTVKLGRDLQAGETPLAVVKGGWLFGATVSDPLSYALAGCTVAPGFDFADFEIPSRQELLQQYPQHRHIIEMLTR